ncbi:MAG: hypothetical protein KGH54_02050 [Candidatus Micrarchaeota archaeon]|nr:hypothetical protein [Candidatus Micrarchaeota archaeon]
MQSLRGHDSAIPTKEQIYQLVNKLIRNATLCTGSVYKTGAEASVATALYENKIGALYEPAIFFGGGGPDFLTRLYRKNRMVQIEIHPIGYLIDSKPKEDLIAYFEKHGKRKTNHPEIYPIFISDLEASQITEIFGIDTKLFSEEYWAIPYASKKKDTISKRIREFIGNQDTRIQENEKEWKTDIAEILEVEKRIIALRKHLRN